MNDLITGLIFTIGSTMFCILLFCIYFFQARINNAKSKIYKTLLIVDIFVLITEFLSSIVLYKVENHLIGEILLKIHWYTGMMYYFFQYFYAYALFKKQDEINIKNIIKDSIFNKIFVIIFAIASVAYFFVPFINLNYDVISYLPAYPVYYVFGYAIFIGILILIMYINKKEKTGAESFYTFFTIAMGVIIIIFQYNIPHLAISPFLISFGLFTTYFLIENPYIYVSKQLLDEQDIMKSEGKVKTDVFKYTKPYLENNINKIIELSNTYDASKVNDTIINIYNAAHETLFDIEKVFDVMFLDGKDNKLEEKKYDIKVILSNAINYANYAKLHKEAQLLCDIDQNLPTSLIGDGNKLFQLLLATLYSSVKNTNVGKITLSVKCIRDNGNVILNVKITDTSNGLKEDEYSDVINKLNDVDHNLDSLDKNLIFIKKFSDYLNGSFKYTSTYMVGNTYEFSITQKIADATPIGVINFVNNFNYFDLSNKKIILVDAVNTNVVNYFKPYHINYEVVDSIDNVINKLKGNDVLDIVLINPTIDKSEEHPAQTIKSVVSSMGINIPLIVAITSNNVVGTRKKLLDDGFDDVIFKPVDDYELNKIMEKINK